MYNIPVYNQKLSNTNNLIIKERKNKHTIIQTWNDIKNVSSFNNT